MKEGTNMATGRQTRYFAQNSFSRVSVGRGQSKIENILQNPDRQSAGIMTNIADRVGRNTRPSNFRPSARSIVSLHPSLQNDWLLESVM